MIIAKKKMKVKIFCESHNLTTNINNITIMVYFNTHCVKVEKFDEIFEVFGNFIYEKPSLCATMTVGGQECKYGTAIISFALPTSHDINSVLEMSSDNYIVVKVTKHEGSAPCVSEKSQILTPIGHIFASNIKVGDTVCAFNDNNNQIETQVIAILETKINCDIDVYTNSEGLEITAWHPVKINDSWVFPAESTSFTKTNTHISSLFSFALESGHVLIINNTKVIGLAHHIDTNDVTTHNYFGSSSVLDDIRLMNPLMHATIEDLRQVKKDPITDRVCKIITYEELCAEN